MKKCLFPLDAYIDQKICDLSNDKVIIYLLSHINALHTGILENVNPEWQCSVSTGLQKVIITFQKTFSFGSLWVFKKAGSQD